MPIVERKRIRAKRMKASPSKSSTRATEVIFKHACVLGCEGIVSIRHHSLRLVTKYGDHMQTHLVDPRSLRARNAPTRRGDYPRLRSAPDADDCMPASMTLVERFQSSNHMGCSKRPHPWDGKSKMPLEEIDILAGQSRTPEFLAKNSSGAVPVLELDDGSYLSRVSSNLPLPGGASSRTKSLGARPPRTGRGREMESSDGTGAVRCHRTHGAKHQLDLSRPLQAIPGIWRRTASDSQ